MKTKEEILEHLKRTGYNVEATTKIMGYLLGANVVEKGEIVNFFSGEKTFDEFFEWVNEKPRKNKFADIAANLDYLLGFFNAKDRAVEGINEKTLENVQFLMNNKEYLQECMERKEEAEVFLEDVTEVLKGLNKSLESIFKK